MERLGKIKVMEVHELGWVFCDIPGVGRAVIQHYLVHVMFRRMVGTKPLPESMLIRTRVRLTDYQLDIFKWNVF